MYDPKFRFMLVASFILVTYWVYNITTNYLFGDKGLNFEYYINGIFSVGSGVLGGFIFVWISTKFVTFQQYRKTGFEATTIDETGTRFNMRLSLSKFLPNLIAPPHNKFLTPLESDLFGFLNGFRDWPYDLENPLPHGKSLFKHSYDIWKAMQTLPNAGPLHRAAALAQDLSKTYVYQLSRKTYPFIKFWKRDKITYSQRCQEHGGLSAFVLSTMPTFRDLSKKDRRAILTAIRYVKDPISIPSNCDPLARDIYESLNKAALHARRKESDSLDILNPSEKDIKAFGKTVKAYLQGALIELNVNPADISDESDGVYIGGGRLILRLPRLTSALSTVLAPDIRTVFNLWDKPAGPHPIWLHLINQLKEQNFLEDHWEDIHSPDGLFKFKVNNIFFNHAIILNIKASQHPTLRKHFEQLPKWHGIIELQQDEEAILKDIQQKVTAVDTLLKEKI